MRNTGFNAYLTVYLSLVFTVILSLILALVEGATIGASRAQAEIVADLGLDSAFAEYNREILKQYELFFVDTSYGDEYGGIGELREHIKNYMEYNMQSDKGLSIAGTTYLMLNNPHLEIEEVSYASDKNGDVWKAQAIAYMKAVYGGDLISSIKDNINIANENQLFTKNIKEDVLKQKEDFEEILLKKGIVEYSSESEDGYSYEKLIDMLDYLTGEGILSLVMPEGKAISNKYTDKNKYLSHRISTGKINKGAGLHKGVKVPSGIDDELIYGEYLMKMCGNYANEKADGELKYQIEYILFGNDSDVSNLRVCVEKLFAFRSVSNYLYLSNDYLKRKEVSVISTILCALLLSPELSDALTNIILGVWAMAEAIIDIKGLLCGESVPLMKDSSDWNLSLSSIFFKDISQTNTGSDGLSYEDYLRVFLGFMDSKEKVIRSLDIVEMDIRKAEGNETFRIDRCIDYMRVNFGFSDARGHEFVFSRSMCFD